MCLSRCNEGGGRGSGSCEGMTGSLESSQAGEGGRFILGRTTAGCLALPYGDPKPGTAILPAVLLVWDPGDGRRRCRGCCLWRTTTRWRFAAWKPGEGARHAVRGPQAQAPSPSPRRRQAAPGGPGSSISGRFPRPPANQQAARGPKRACRAGACPNRPRKCAVGPLGAPSVPSRRRRATGRAILSPCRRRPAAGDVHRDKRRRGRARRRGQGRQVESGGHGPAAVPA